MIYRMWSEACVYTRKRERNTIAMENTNLLSKNNLTMLTDFYEITMANGFFATGQGEKTVYFDMFFRTIPDGGGLAIMAGSGTGHQLHEKPLFHGGRSDLSAGKEDV